MQVKFCTMENEKCWQWLRSPHGIYEKTTHRYLCEDCGGCAHCFGGTKDKVRSFVPPIFRVENLKI